MIFGNVCNGLANNTLWSTGMYRFAFNGMEKPACRNVSAGRDDEITSTTGTHYDFGARIYDSRIGRWLSLDPLAKEYPQLSDYCFVANSPIFFIDSDGKKIKPARQEDVGNINNVINSFSTDNMSGADLFGIGGHMQ